MRGAEGGIQFGCQLERCLGFFVAAQLPVELTDVVARLGLVGDEYGHLLELRQRAFVVPELLVLDAEVEPCVRDGRVELLSLFKPRDAFVTSACPELGQRVVDLLLDGVRVQLKRLPQRLDRLLGTSGVFIEGLPEVA